MHICHIVQDNVGGAPKIAELLVRHQNQRGIRTSVVLLRERKAGWSTFDHADQVFALSVKTNQTPLLGSRLLRYLYSDLLRILKLKFALRKLRPNIIIAHDINVVRTFFISQHLPFRSRAATVAYLHSEIEKGIDTNFRTILKPLISMAKRLSVLAMNSFDGSVFVSKSLFEKYARKDSAILCYNPVVLNRQSRMPLHPLAETWFKDQHLQTFVCADRMCLPKDHVTLLKAFSKVITMHASARLILLGDGPLLAAHKGLSHSLGLDNHVLFVGFAPNPMAYFESCNSVILSSDHEGFPLVLIEALASGAQFIASDCKEGPREIADLFGEGLLFTPRDTDQLAGLIIRRINHPDKIRIPTEKFEPFREERFYDRISTLLSRITFTQPRTD